MKYLLLFAVFLLTGCSSKTHDKAVEEFWFNQGYRAGQLINPRTHEFRGEDTREVFIREKEDYANLISNKIIITYVNNEKKGKNFICLTYRVSDNKILRKELPNEKYDDQRLLKCIVITGKIVNTGYVDWGSVMANLNSVSEDWRE